MNALATERLIRARERDLLHWMQQRPWRWSNDEAARCHRRIAESLAREQALREMLEEMERQHELNVE